MRYFVLRSVLLGAVLITGCSTNNGSGGGSVSIADSQTASSQATDFGIVYVKRAVPSAQDDLRTASTALAPTAPTVPAGTTAVLASANLYMSNPTVNGGAEQSITASITKTAPAGMFYDIKDVDVSPDGTKVIFAMRGPITAKQKDSKPPNWAIWEYVIATSTLHSILPNSDPTGSEAHYVSPHYLPDGRILFASTIQIDSRAVLLNEGKEQFSGQTEDLTDMQTFTLHVMNPDGTGLHQISYNQSHDVDVSVLASGRVMWSRWDHANGNDGIHLYTSNPDGTDVQLLYGRGSHNTAATNPSQVTTCPAGEDCTVQFVRTREMLDGKVLSLVRGFTNAGFGGSLMILDVQNYAENNQAYPNTPANSGAAATTTAATAATANAVLTACVGSCMTAGAAAATTNIPVISPGGRFSSAFPLWDGTGRILVTWSECRLQGKTGTIVPCTSANLALANAATPTLTAAPVLYSVWMFNPADNTFKPLTTPVEGVFIDDIVALQPRTTPPFYIADSYTTTTTPTGILDIRSVYDWDGAPWQGLPSAATASCAAVGSIAAMAQTEADCRPARFLRLEKAVSIPNKETLNFDKQTAFGVAGNYMREILGYVPIEPDGSVRALVPANVAFQISVVDASGQRIFPQHSAWLQLLPGEVLSCNGCHMPPGQQNPAPGVSTYSHGRQGLWSTVWAGASAPAIFPGTTGSYTTCTNADGTGETMAEALVGENCNMASGAAATPSVNVVFNDPWFGGGKGNEPILLSYDDPTFTTPLPTAQTCALPGGWTTNCRVIINYPTIIQPLWDKCRMAGSPTCPAGTTVGTGTCTASTCHTASTLATGYLDLADGAVATQDNAYVALTTPFTVTTVNPATGVVTTTTVRGAEFNSGDAIGSHFFQVFATDPTHVGLLSPAELRLLTEWVDIGAQYYNNPFNAPLAAN